MGTRCSRSSTRWTSSAPRLARGAERAGAIGSADRGTSRASGRGRAAARRSRGDDRVQLDVSTNRRCVHHGFGGQADKIRAAWQQRDWAGMAAAVTDEMLAAIASPGRPTRSAEQYEERRAGLFEPGAGVDPVRRAGGGRQHDRGAGAVGPGRAGGATTSRPGIAAHLLPVSAPAADSPPTEASGLSRATPDRAGPPLCPRPRRDPRAGRGVRDRLPPRRAVGEGRDARRRGVLHAVGLPDHRPAARALGAVRKPRARTSSGCGGPGGCCPRCS